MVCEKCEKKLSTIITPDVWKAGSMNNAESGRKMGASAAASVMRTSKTKNRMGPYMGKNKCRECKCPVIVPNGVLCNTCAYKSGQCAGCGKEQFDVSSHKMSCT
jgi:hypothetical protein